MSDRRKFWQLGMTLHILNIGLLVTMLLTLASFFVLLKTMAVEPNSWAWRANLILIQIFFCGVIFTFLITTFYLVHRSLGPLMRVEKLLEDVLKGGYAQRIAIRDKDFMCGFMEKVNAVLAQLEATQKK
jgi:signal transduction histidine kinase